MSFRIDSFPPEILSFCLDKLNTKDKIKVCLVCKDWQKEILKLISNFANLYDVPLESNYHKTLMWIEKNVRIIENKTVLYNFLRSITGNLCTDKVVSIHYKSINNPKSHLYLSMELTNKYNQMKKSLLQLKAHEDYFYHSAAKYILLGKETADYSATEPNEYYSTSELTGGGVGGGLIGVWKWLNIKITSTYIDFKFPEELMMFIIKKVGLKNESTFNAIHRSISNCDSVKFSIPYDPDEAFVWASKNGEIKLIKDLINNPKLNFEKIYKEALYYARQNGHKEIIDEILATKNLLEEQVNKQKN